MNYQPDHAARHQCLVCGEPNARITRSGWGDGSLVETSCPDCKSIGTVSNMEPWFGYELSLEQLQALFVMAGIPIIGEPMKIMNQYWQGHDKKYYHPWWFVKTARGWIRLGWRKRVISIDWSDTDVRCIVTEDEVTKEDTGVHAYKIEDAVRYMVRLRKAFDDTSASAIEAMAIKLYRAAGLDADRWAKLDELDAGRHVQSHYRTLAKVALS